MMSVSAYMTVCLSADISQKPHGQTSTNFLCMLTLARLIWQHFILQVLWMECFHTVGPMGIP